MGRSAQLARRAVCSPASFLVFCLLARGAPFERVVEQSLSEADLGSPRYVFFVSSEALSIEDLCRGVSHSGTCDRQHAHDDSTLKIAASWSGYQRGGSGTWWKFSG